MRHQNMIKEFSTALYRYDLNQPPPDWTPTFFNFEYDTNEYGHKNKANLFFFTDSINIAKDLGKNAAQKYSRAEYFLTSLRSSRVKLIDFSSSYNIYQMLSLLQELNIDVLVKEFKTYEDDNDFSQLRSFFEAALIEPDDIKRLHLIQNLKVHSASDFTNISLFGQRLTDFDNGLKFKEKVKKIYPDVDGYIWREFQDKRGLTHCLFDAQKLIAKSTEKIEL